MKRLFSLLLALTLIPAAYAQSSISQRIVSMNVCTDQLLLWLVEPARIAALSHFAADPAWSSLAAQAAGIPVNRGQPDEVVALEPDLVLTSAFSGTFAARVLERLQLRVERLGFAASREEVYHQIAQMAAWTDRNTAGQQMIIATRARIDASVQQLQPRLAGNSALFLSSNGIAFGSSTLQDDFLRSLGLRNVAAEAGLSGPAPLSLELLLQAAPDFIISEARGELDSQLAHPFLQHAALQRLNPRRLNLPDRWFDCAGPWLADAYVSIATQLDAAP